MDGPRSRRYGARGGYDVRTRCIRDGPAGRQGVRVLMLRGSRSVPYMCTSVPGTLTSSGSASPTTSASGMDRIGDLAPTGDVRVGIGAGRGEVALPIVGRLRALGDQ